jgi:hypothetical protein
MLQLGLDGEIDLEGRQIWQQLSKMTGRKLSAGILRQRMEAIQM